jgi:uncharacterized protein YecE (DUF72 family)
MKKDCARLEDFLRLLPKTRRHAVEFRHLSWFEDDVALEILKKHRAAFVSVSSGKMPVKLAVTADFIYIRFHGLAGGAAHDYTRAELKPWADHIKAHPDKTVFTYFNNDVNVRAPQNARELMSMVGERAFGPFASEMPDLPRKHGRAVKKNKEERTHKLRKKIRKGVLVSG